MKNIFAIEVIDQNNSKFKGESFVLRKVDETLQTQKDENEADYEQLEKKANLPKWVAIIKYIIFMACLILTISIIKALGEVGVTAFSNAPGIFYGCGIGWIIFLVLFVIEKTKKKKVENTNEYGESINKQELLIKESLEQLKVPQDSVSIDFFSAIYKVKKGIEKNAFPYANFINFSFYTFIEDNNICFADHTSVVAIPKESFTKLIKHEKRVSFMGWHKEIKPDEGIYKQYKMTFSNMGQILIKNYYSLQFEYENNQYEILFPPYELDEISRLINIENIEKEITKK